MKSYLWEIVGGGKEIGGKMGEGQWEEKGWKIMAACCVGCLAGCFLF